MKEWHLQCVDRQTGDESTQVFITETQAEAIDTANKRGFMVGKLVKVVDLHPPAPVPSTASDPAQPVVPAGSLSRSRRSDGLTLLGVLCLLGGIAVVAFAGLMDTSVSSQRDLGFGVTVPDRVHNMGLIQRQDFFTTCGCTLCIMGAVLFGLGRLGAELCEWGSTELRALRGRPDGKGQ